jgi:phosphatidylserine decarboxylase
MTLHREGTTIIVSTLLLCGGISALSLFFMNPGILSYSIIGICAVLFFMIVQFFRVPKRLVSAKDNEVICPADGKVVVIEEVEETEYFKGRRLQVSVFMSPINVHVNWSPIAGDVTYAKYHPGKYLVAWHPKSSTENERTTVVVRDSRGNEVLFRQIAGALARRICLYAKEGMKYQKGDEFGFIKFGSRVDIFLPLGSDVKVSIGDKVKGKQTIIAII